MATYDIPTMFIILAYRRILKAAKSGKGVRLSADECECIALDDAVASAATNEYDFDKKVK